MGRNHSVLGRIKLEIRRLFVFVIRESIREAVFMVVKITLGANGRRKIGITVKSAYEKTERDFNIRGFTFKRIDPVAWWSSLSGTEGRSWTVNNE